MANFVAVAVGSDGWHMVYDADDHKHGQAAALFAPHLVVEAREFAERLNIRALAAESVKAASEPKGGD